MFLLESKNYSKFLHLVWKSNEIHIHQILSYFANLARFSDKTSENLMKPSNYQTLTINHEGKNWNFQFKFSFLFSANTLSVLRVRSQKKWGARCWARSTISKFLIEQLDFNLGTSWPDVDPIDTIIICKHYT